MSSVKTLLFAIFLIFCSLSSYNATHTKLELTAASQMFEKFAQTLPKKSIYIVTPEMFASFVKEVQAEILVQTKLKSQTTSEQNPSDIGKEVQSNDAPNNIDFPKRIDAPRPIQETNQNIVLTPPPLTAITIIIKAEQNAKSRENNILAPLPVVPIDSQKTDNAEHRTEAPSDQEIISALNKNQDVNTQVQGDKDQPREIMVTTTLGLKTGIAEAIEKETISSNKQNNPFYREPINSAVLNDLFKLLASASSKQVQERNNNLSVTPSGLENFTLSEEERKKAEENKKLYEQKVQEINAVNNEVNPQAQIEPPTNVASESGSIPSEEEEPSAVIGSGNPSPNRTAPENIILPNPGAKVTGSTPNDEKNTNQVLTPKGLDKTGFADNHETEPGSLSVGSVAVKPNNPSNEIIISKSQPSGAEQIIGSGPLITSSAPPTNNVTKTPTSTVNTVGQPSSVSDITQTVTKTASNLKGTDAIQSINLTKTEIKPIVKTIVTEVKKEHFNVSCKIACDITSNEKVCGWKTVSSYTEYANKCVACQDSEVRFVSVGSCNSISLITDENSFLKGTRKLAENIYLTESGSLLEQVPLLESRTRRNLSTLPNTTNTPFDPTKLDEISKKSREEILSRKHMCSKLKTEEKITCESGEYILPVCGWSLNNNEWISKDYLNSCTACEKVDVIYTVFGKC